VASVEVVVKLWSWSYAGTGNGKVNGERVSVAERFRVCHFDTFENSGFIEIEPVTEEIEGCNAQGSVDVFEKVITVDIHGIG
jgi:hypothetical protein